jgi:hypothetical protein
VAKAHSIGHACALTSGFFLAGAALILLLPENRAMELDA